jgi:hypothetical protein
MKKIKKQLTKCTVKTGQLHDIPVPTYARLINQLLSAQLLQ